jgi:hypothetical protein
MPHVNAPQQCETCGTTLVLGPEPIDPDMDTEVSETGERFVLVEWCPNLACPSQDVLSHKGLRQVGANQYLCTVCGTSVSGPSGEYLRHHMAHGPPQMGH